MTFSEFIEAVGNDNVKYQKLNECLSGQQQQKKGFVQISFATQEISIADLISDNPTTLGYVIWLPRDKVQRVINKLNKEKSIT